MLPSLKPTSLPRRANPHSIHPHRANHHPIHPVSCITTSPTNRAYPIRGTPRPGNFLRWDKWLTRVPRDDFQSCKLPVKDRGRHMTRQNMSIRVISRYYNSPRLANMSTWATNLNIWLDLAPAQDYPRFLIPFRSQVLPTTPTKAIVRVWPHRHLSLLPAKARAVNEMMSLLSGKAPIMQLLLIDRQALQVHSSTIRVHPTPWHLHRVQCTLAMYYHLILRNNVH